MKFGKQMISLDFLFTFHITVYVFCAALAIHVCANKKLPSRGRRARRRNIIQTAQFHEHFSAPRAQYTTARTHTLHTRAEWRQREVQRICIFLSFILLVCAAYKNKMPQQTQAQQHADFATANK